MKRPTARAVVLAAALLQACAPMPQNAEEFRKAVPGAMMAKTESYEVNRAMRDVAATFRRKAPECLNDKPAVALGIPAGRWSYLVFDFATSRYLGASRGRISRETLLKPRAGYRYEIDVTYRDDIYDVVIREQARRRARGADPQSHFLPKSFRGNTRVVALRKRKSVSALDALSTSLGNSTICAVNWRSCKGCCASAEMTGLRYG